MGGQGREGGEGREGGREEGREGGRDGGMEMRDDCYTYSKDTTIFK